uniref:Uncharacterized protein n=1 Tax=Anguilla anguilla TaxID=7936 RepID=A0A0E9UTT6_ANGAN
MNAPLSLLKWTHVGLNLFPK